MNGTIDYSTDMPSTSLNLGSVTAILSVIFTLTVTMVAVVVARLFIRTSGGARSVGLMDWAHLLACVCEPPIRFDVLNLNEGNY